MSSQKGELTLLAGSKIEAEDLQGRLLPVPGGREGIKLEDQCLITETGFERMTTYPFDARLMG